MIRDKSRIRAKIWECIGQRWRWQERGSLLHEKRQSDLSHAVFLSPFRGIRSGTRIAKTGKIRRDRIGKLTPSAISSALESTSCETTIACFIQKPKNFPYAHWHTHVRAHKWRGARSAAWRYEEFDGGGGGGDYVTCMCTRRAPKEREGNSIAPKCDVEIGWLADSSSLPAYVSQKLAPASFSIRKDSKRFFVLEVLE